MVSERAQVDADVPPIGPAPVTSLKRVTKIAVESWRAVSCVLRFWTGWISGDCRTSEWRIICYLLSQYGPLDADITKKALEPITVCCEIPSQSQCAVRVPANHSVLREFQPITAPGDKLMQSCWTVCWFGVSPVLLTCCVACVCVKRSVLRFISGLIRVSSTSINKGSPAETGTWRTKRSSDPHVILTKCMSAFYHRSTL